jgi:Major Facilitator Superfamily
MHGLYLLWWVQEKHIPAPTLAVLLAAGDLALMALELPTGWFADRFGHRKSLIAGSAVQVAGMLLCWLGQGVPGVLAASLLVALGDALRSGADQALLYRTCLALDREADFQRIQGQTYAWQAVALLLQVLAGGFIVQRWGFAAGWIVETILCAIGLGIAYAMVEPPSASDTRSESVDRTADDGDARPTLHPRASRVRFIALMLPAAFVASGHTATAFLVQTTGGSSAAQMTWLVAAIVFAEAIGSAIATGARDAGLRIQVAIGLFGALTLVIGLAVRPVLVPSAIVLSLLDGLALPLRSVAIQRLANDAVRARAASLASACDMALKMIALPLAGSRRDRSRFLG